MKDQMMQTDGNPYAILSTEEEKASVTTADKMSENINRNSIGLTQPKLLKALMSKRTEDLCMFKDQLK
jgi:hypothetical protein